LFGASAVAVWFAPSRPALATLIIACVVAVVAASHAPATLEQRVTAGDRIPASRLKPMAISDLNLAGEPPTSRSYDEVFAGVLTPATWHRTASAPRRARWVVTLGAVVFVMIGWLAVFFNESAVWTVLTRVAVATAALSLVVGMATRRRNADKRSLEVDRESTDARKTLNLLDTTRASLDVRGEDTGATVRRSR
jgi:hypothetical protein